MMYWEFVSNENNSNKKQMHKNKLKLEISVSDVCKMGNASTVCVHKYSK